MANNDQDHSAEELAGAVENCPAEELAGEAEDYPADETNSEAEETLRMLRWERMGVPASEKREKKLLVDLHYLHLTRANDLRTDILEETEAVFRDPGVSELLTALTKRPERARTWFRWIQSHVNNRLSATGLCLYH